MSRFHLVTVVFAVVTLGLVVSSCEKDATGPSTPAAMDSTAFTDSTMEQRAAVSTVDAHVATIKQANTTGTPLSPTQLSAYWRASSVLWQRSAPAIRLYIDSLHTVCVAIAGRTFDTTNAPNGTGGVYYDVLLDKYGLEPAELIAKSLYVSALYYGALTDARIPTLQTRTRLQRIVAALGGTPAFANTDDASNPQRDKGLMKYVARRDKNDGAGPYARIKSAILTLQDIGSGNAARRSDSAAAERMWRAAAEEAIARTAISYFLETIKEMNAATDDEGRADAMHDYSEAIGLLYGLRALDAADRTITTAQIDEICTLALAPWGGTPTSYLLWQSPAALQRLDAATGAVSKLAAIYSLSAADVQDCTVNWVTQQGRK